MNQHPEISHIDREDRIRAIAYFIWQEEGQPDDRAAEHWERAEALVDAEAQTQMAQEACETGEPTWLVRADIAPTVAAEPAPEPAKPDLPATLESLARRLSKSARAA